VLIEKVCRKYVGVETHKKNCKSLNKFYHTLSPGMTPYLGGFTESLPVHQASDYGEYNSKEKIQHRTLLYPINSGLQEIDVKTIKEVCYNSSGFVSRPLEKISLIFFTGKILSLFSFSSSDNPLLNASSITLVALS